MKILVFDDVPNLERQYAARLNKLKAVKQKWGASNVESLTPAQFQGAVAILERRQKESRSRKKRVWTDCAFDEASILIMDYDLLNLQSATACTAEAVAYLARCYSKCGLIVILNQFGDNIFDLTLRGHLNESFADLNIGSSQLDNQGLWEGSWSGFRPWYWPLLPKAAEDFEQRVSVIGNHLGSKIYEYFGFVGTVQSRIPRPAAEFVAQKNKPENVTFAGFLRDSMHGYRGKDESFSDEFSARVIASRISKWLERLVLAGQDVIVDAPHLISRFPSLLKGNVKKIGSWNATTNLLSDKDIGIDLKLLSDFKFERTEWVSRAAWFWPLVSSSEKIKEVVEPWSTKKPDWVFCEDSSRFAERTQCKEFVADIPSPFVRRYVAGVKGVDYRPQIRFAL